MVMRDDLTSVRVRKDVNELAKAKFTCNQAKTKIEFPDGEDNMRRMYFTISLDDHSGPYANGDFTFIVEIPKTYPFHPPIVTCVTKTWHPNIDVRTGRVMVPILGRDWGPVLSINTVLLGLQLIFLEPGIDYVLNTIAGREYTQDANVFRDQVQQILLGGRYYGIDFPSHPRQVRKQENLYTNHRELHTKQRKRSYTNISKDIEPEDVCMQVVEDQLYNTNPTNIGQDIISCESMQDSFLSWKRSRIN